MAASRLMLGAHLDDLSPLDGLPSRYGLFAELAPLEKNVQRHDQNHVAERDLHSSVPDFVFRHILDKRWQRHSKHPTHSYTERPRVCLWSASLINDDNETGLAFSTNRPANNDNPINDDVPYEDAA